MEQNINERFVFAGSKTGGSQRIPINFEINIGVNVVVMVNTHRLIFNCVKAEFFDNQDGTLNAVYVLKSTLE